MPWSTVARVESTTCTRAWGNSSRSSSAALQADWKEPLKAAFRQIHRMGMKDAGLVSDGIAQGRKKSLVRVRELFFRHLKQEEIDLDRKASR